MAKISTDAQAQAVMAKGDSASQAELDALAVYEKVQAAHDENEQKAKAEAEAKAKAEADEAAKAEAEALFAEAQANTAKKTIGQRTTPANDLLIRLAAEGYIDNTYYANGEVLTSSDWKDITVSLMPSVPDGDKEPRLVYLSELVNITENGLKRVAESLDEKAEAKKQLAKLKKTGLSKAELLALLDSMED